MSLEGVRAVHNLPSTTLEGKAGDDIFSQSIFRETSDVSDRAATEHDTGPSHPCTVHTITLDLIELTVHIETLVQWVVGRHVIEPLRKATCQLAT
jgi:hypothetical protein